MMGMILKTQSPLEEIGAGNLAAGFGTETGFEDAPVMFEDEVDLVDLMAFQALDPVIEDILAAGVAEFFIRSAAEGSAAGLAGRKDRFGGLHGGSFSAGKIKRNWDLGGRKFGTGEAKY